MATLICPHCKRKTGLTVRCRAAGPAVMFFEEENELHTDVFTDRCHFVSVSGAVRCSDCDKIVRDFRFNEEKMIVERKETS